MKRGFSKARIVRFAYRPFDLRWLYWEPETKLLNEKRSDYVPQVFDGNRWIAAAQQNRKSFDPPVVVQRHATLHIIERGANLFPMLVQTDAKSREMVIDKDRRPVFDGNQRANVSEASLLYLEEFAGVSDSPHLFQHAIAIMHSPAYATENASALRQDWPRIPLPASRERLVASGNLGHMVANLLDPESPVAGVTAGVSRPELKLLGRPSRADGGSLSGDDFAVTARWGVAGKGGITMPSTGDARPREFSIEEVATLGTAVAALLGPDTLDIYLNDAAYWRNVPRNVWEYSLGGYQVLKKWLSYREQALLGRPLTVDEIAYVTQVIRRIAALILLGPELDANYHAVKDDTYPWPSGAEVPLTSEDSA